SDRACANLRDHGSRVGQSRLIGPYLRSHSQMPRSLVHQLTMLVVIVLGTVSIGWTSELPAEMYTEWSTEKEIFVPMRDGQHLSTDVSVPKGAAGRLSTVLVRTPYDKDTLENQVTLGWTKFFLKHGYAVVVQNERGRFFSEGRFDNFLQGAS